MDRCGSLILKGSDKVAVHVPLICSPTLLLHARGDFPQTRMSKKTAWPCAYCTAPISEKLGAGCASLYCYTNTSEFKWPNRPGSRELVLSLYFKEVCSGAPSRRLKKWEARACPLAPAHRSCSLIGPSGSPLGQRRPHSADCFRRERLSKVLPHGRRAWCDAGKKIGSTV